MKANQFHFLHKSSTIINTAFFLSHSSSPYINKLEKDKIGVDGISTKLDRLHMAFKYATRTQKITPAPGQIAVINDQLTEWRATLRRKKPALQLERELESGRDNDTVSLQTIEAFFANSQLPTPRYWRMLSKSHQISHRQM